MKLCTKFQGKRASRSGTGARGTWQPMIFTYFASSSRSKFSWQSLFNLDRNTCSLYWCNIFSFVNIFTKNINTERTCYSIAIGNGNIHRKRPMLESLFNKVADLQPWIFSNKKRLQHRCSPVNVQNFKNSFFTEHFRWLLLNREMGKVKNSKIRK